MGTPVYAQLMPVRQRQQWLFALRTTILGLLASSLAGMALGLGRWLAGWSFSPWFAAGLLAAGPVGGIVVGLAWRRAWHAAAAAVDAHYRLKDRTATALAFLAKPDKPALYELQINDAVQHLAAVEPRQVVPLRMPRTLPYALALLVVAVALITWPAGPQTLEAAPVAPLAGIVETAETIEEDIKAFEELARQEKDPDLEKLIQELKEKVEEMKQPGVDSREALAKLSEMQAALEAQQTQYNVAMVDAQLKAVGEAMSLAQSLENAGKALVEGKFQKATEELAKLEEPELERKEAKAVEEKLKKAAAEIGEAGFGALSEAASEMSEGLQGASGKFKEGTRKLATQVSKHERRKKINDLLCKECNSLAECKCKCEANSLAKGLKPVKSLSPSNSFGMSTSGNVAGEKTDSAGKTNLEQITGQATDGPSEVETTHSVEGRQAATRGYRDTYQKYRKLSESVLDTEPIPLGHRQTIRRYFELIRPQSDESKPAAE